MSDKSEIQPKVAYLFVEKCIDLRGKVVESPKHFSVLKKIITL